MIALRTPKLPFFFLKERARQRTESALPKPVDFFKENHHSLSSMKKL
jgi:hypothetical protein